MARASLRRVLPPLVIALLALHLAFSVVPSLLTIRNDFVNYYVTARARFEGQRLDRAYERAWFENERARLQIPTLGLFLPNPPANALLLLPLAGLPPHGAKAAWSGFLAFCLLASYLLLRRVVSVSPWFLGLVFLVPSVSARNALLYGQPYPLFLLLLCSALLAARRERSFLCGALLAPIVVLKLYGLVFLPYFLWTRRWRAAAGLLTGVGSLTLLSVVLLGPDLHLVYLREMLEPSLTGRVLDPYSPSWQSLSGLSRRLFCWEPELNPSPVVDWPVLAEGLARSLAPCVLGLAVLCTSREGDFAATKRDWAMLTLAALAASPLTATYHFVLLVLPAALLLEQGWGRGWRLSLLLVLLAFNTSSLPHFSAAWASGWGNLLACPRLVASLAFLVMALGARVSLGRLALSVAIGGVAGLGVPRGKEESWTRVQEARGIILAEPVACLGDLLWATVQGESFLIRGTSGRLYQGGSPRCFEGRLLTTDTAFEAVAGSVPEAVSPLDVDVMRRQGDPLVVFVDRAGRLRERERLGERTLASGTIRHPRLSPDGAWVVYQSFETGSWNLWIVERETGRKLPLTRDAANEVEPSWSETGQRIFFASDRRRGLGATALFSVAFAGLP